MSEEVKISEENQFSFENPEYRKTYWHTCSHVLAQAVKRLWPEVKLAIGPSIDNGFYYDMLAPFSFTPENLAEIEAEMRKICKEKLKLERFELPRAEAIKFMEEKEEPFKVELINDLPEDAVISFYKQGEFTDLCAGPHLDSTGRIKGNGIKLTACNAAYWRGDSNRQTLQRIYGIAFPKKDELDAYLKRIEEAKKRDHRKLGKELGLFMTSEKDAKGKKHENNPKGTDMKWFPIYQHPTKGCTLTDVSKIKSAKCEVLSNGNYKITIVLKADINPEPCDPKTGVISKGFTGTMFSPLAKADIDNTLHNDPNVTKVVKDVEYSLKYYDCTAVLTYNPKTNHMVDLYQYMHVLVTGSGKVLGSKFSGNAVLDNYLEITNVKY